MRMLDLFCGRFGWSRAFAAQGWECVGIDLAQPKEVPPNTDFCRCDVTSLATWDGHIFLKEDLDTSTPGYDFGEFDFICASSPCEQFSVHCMKFTKKKNHPYPDLGIKLFNHTRAICEASGIPYVMENVRCAEQFVGPAAAHAGSFYLWGNSVPPLLPKGLIKMGNQGGWRRGDGSFRERATGCRKPAARSATIPPELAHCVADYAERIIEATGKQSEDSEAQT